MDFLSNNFISDAIVFVFKWCFEFIYDYGIVIIILTLLIKLLMLPLDLKQRNSTRKMGLISEEVKSIQKRYANNPDQMNKKVSELYKQRGVSPMAGCWPMLVSMVFLFAFYGALRVIAAEQTVSIFLEAAENGAETVQLPGLLWIRNIFQADNGMVSALPNAKDFLSFAQTNSSYITPAALKQLIDAGILSLENGTMNIGPQFEAIRSGMLTANGCMENGVEIYNNGWFVLPVLAAASMILQTKLTSKMGGNAQAANNQPGGKLMTYLFPVMSLFICLNSNAIFSIYWVMSNVFSIALTVGIHMFYKYKDKHKIITAENFRK